jgi:hypothetical protein
MGIQAPANESPILKIVKGKWREVTLLSIYLLFYSSFSWHFYKVNEDTYFKNNFRTGGETPCLFFHYKWTNSLVPAYYKISFFRNEGPI